MTKRRSCGRARRGAVLVLVAVLMVVLVSVAALSVDGGRLFQERRNVQAASDLAAEAAGIELYQRFEQFQGADGDGEARAAALAIAAANGYPEASPTSTVRVNIPPVTGPYQGQKGFAEVIITSQLSRAFSGIFGSNDLAVTSRSVAAGTMIPSKASILVLDPKKKGSLKLKGKNSSISVQGDIVVDSKSKDAVKVDKKSQIHAEHLLVTGSVSRKSKGLIDADVQTGVVATSDPMQSLPTPAKSTTLDPNDFKTSVNGKDVFKLPPGTYKELKFSKDDVVQMQPGIFHVENGVEFKGSTSVDGQEVMIFNAGKKGFKIESTGEVSITPPTSGIYEGISLFQNRIGKSRVEFKKGDHLDVEGVVYAPNSEVKFKNANVDTGDYEDDEDFETDSDEGLEDDSGSSLSLSSIGASFISRRLSVEKGSLVRISGVNINVQRPLRGLVE